MNTEAMLINLLLCGLLGLIGQGVRVIVGLKKLNEEATEKATDLAIVAGGPGAKAVFNAQFDVRKLWLSLFIGFIAGCLASLTRSNEAANTVSNDVVLAILAAGYAGTDFIEGVFKKLLPGS
jgi:hypothetical protein